MGDLMKAISNDQDDYVKLCRKYGERVREKDFDPDCYGKHAKSLERREERKLRQKNNKGKKKKKKKK